ncbi:hypothetical protein BRADI_2g36165v3, partial [Brachypodium distachyon]
VWDLAAPPEINQHSWTSYICSILWHIWKAWNDIVFNAITCSATEIISRAASYLATWRHRFKPKDREDVLHAWAFLLNCI